MISNGPGELTTWVKPLAENLHSKLNMLPRVSNANITFRLVLVPCPNATGQETEVARRWGQFELITAARSFWNLLVFPNQFASWPTKGLVVFLGGDQFWSVLLAARLGYRHMTYGEWIVRWPQWNDRIAAMSSNVKNRLPQKFKQRCRVVGDLMADLPTIAKKEEPLPKGSWIALLPGSKKIKLSIGVPFMLEVADHLKKLRPESNFLLPIAPTTNLNEIQQFVSSQNPIAKQYKSNIANIIPPEGEYKFLRLITDQGTEIHLYEDHPAHIALSQCELALTTVGANTAELGALGVPMIVIVPTQHLNIMQAWDGFLGIIARVPIIKNFLSILISLWRLRKKNFLAWPNISAGRVVVPERIGKIFPIEIAQEADDWLSSPSRLLGQQEDLRSLRGKPGAIGALTEEIIKFLPYNLSKK